MDGLMSILGSQRGDLRYDADTGYAWCSKRLTAALAGVSHNNINLLFKSGQLAATSLGQFVSGKHFEGGLFEDAMIRSDVVQAVIEYYAMYAGHWCNKQAQSVASTLIGFALAAAIKSTLGIDIDDRTVVAQSPTMPMVDVHVGVQFGRRSPHDHLAPLQSHFLEVAKMRKYIKEQYNTPCEQPTKEVMLETIDLVTREFCTALQSAVGATNHTDALNVVAVGYEDANQRIWDAMDRAIADSDITANTRKRLKKYQAIVTYRWNNPATPMPVLADMFDVSISNISTACSKFGYFDLEPKPGVRQSVRTTPTLEV